MERAKRRKIIAKVIIRDNRNIIAALADLDVPIEENRTLHKRLFDGMEKKRKELSKKLCELEDVKLDSLDGRVKISIDDLPAIKKIMSA
ncbi:TPA: hypothetical protein TY419_000012 [Streptococcus suis]|nr:hypothetical protein [Streptococcus suis]HEL2048462.1 hypothetical protein [Streptococcus suis]